MMPVNGWCRGLSASMLLLWSITSNAADTATLLHQLSTPSSARVEIVGENLLQNGRTVSIATYQSEDSIDVTLEFYRSLWAERGAAPGVVENAIDGWHIISHLDEDVNFALQLDSDSPARSSGLLSVLSLVKQDRRPDKLWVQVPEATLLTRTASSELDTRAYTSVYHSQLSAEAVASAFSDWFSGDGWKLSLVKHADGNTVMLFSKGRDHVDLVATAGSDGKSVIVLNEVSADD